MKALISQFTVLLFSLLILSSCVRVDDIPEQVLGEGSLSATINGEDFSATGILVSAEFTEENEVATLAIGAAELPLSGITKAIALVVVSSDGTGIHTGETYNLMTAFKHAAGEYSLDDDATTDIKAVSASTDVATIKISSIDYEEKLVSGTFFFDGVDADDSNTVYEVRDGVFTDVPIK